MKTAAFIAVAGLAAAANAQSGSASWMADVTIVNETTAEWTLSLSMDADTPFVALSATIFDTLNTAGDEFGGVTGWEVLNSLADLTGDLTTTDGQSLFGTNAGQLTVFGPFTSDNPVDILTFTWEAADGFTIGDGPDTVTYSTATENVTLWVGDDKDTATALDITGNVTEAEFSWTVVPTPASAALLGLGGLALARRRR